jgi:Ca2+:H+ antiporter
MTTKTDNSQAPSELRTALASLAAEPLYWLLAAIPVALLLDWFHFRPLWVFVVSGLAIIPLAGAMGRATENLAQSLGAGVGGLLNASFGNAAELIIGLMILAKGPAMYPLVKASITGSIIGNILLVLGMAILLGGLKHPRQTFNRAAAGMGATLLALASIGLIMPTIYFYLFPVSDPAKADHHNIEYLSEEIAVILAIIYLLSLVFSLKTHKHLFAGETDPSSGNGHNQPEWSRRTSVSLLVAATAGVAWMSEILVGTVEQAAHSLGMNQVFIGVIVVAVIGNAAEHSTAVLMAMKNRMDLTIQIAVGSGLQIALFVAPALVFASIPLGWMFGFQQPMDLHFTALEMITVVFSVLVLAMVSQDGESHWMEGVMLLGVYLIAALAFYHLPDPAVPH